MFQAITPKKTKTTNGDTETTNGNTDPSTASTVGIKGWDPYLSTSNFLTSRICLHKMRSLHGREDRLGGGS